MTPERARLVLDLLRAAILAQCVADRLLDEIGKLFGTESNAADSAVMEILNSKRNNDEALTLKDVYELERELEELRA